VIKLIIIIIIIIIIIGASGTISKSTRKYPRNLSGKHEIKELQKSATLGIAHTHTHTHCGKC
jgi:hypothetical protein